MSLPSSNFIQFLFLELIGAASAHFHALSTESNKYIKRAILCSGSAADVWALYDEYEHSEFLYMVSAEMEQPRTSITGLINFLLTAPAQKLVAYSTPRSTFYNTLHFPFAPVIESTLNELNLWFGCL